MGRMLQFSMCDWRGLVLGIWMVSVYHAAAGDEAWDADHR